MGFRCVVFAIKKDPQADGNLSFFEAAINSIGTVGIDTSDSGRLLEVDDAMAVSSIAPSADAAASSWAMELLRQQMHGSRSLHWILQTMRQSSPEDYTKTEHWAWYVWPTKDPGGFHCQTAVDGEADVKYVLSNAQNTALWADILEFCAKAVEAQGRYIFPFEGEINDHPRIHDFLDQWSAYSKLLHQPPYAQFGQAVAHLRDAWNAAADRTLVSLADVGAARVRLEQSRTKPTPDAAMPALPPPPLSMSAPPPPPPPPVR